MTPEGWWDTTLDEIVESGGLQTGPFGSQLKAAEYTLSGTPVVMPKDMASGRVDTSSIARVPREIGHVRLEKHLIQPGDVLFGRRGDIGRCALIEPSQGGWLCGTGCIRARPGNRVHSAFLIQRLLWRPVAAWLIEHAVGQTMLNLNTAILSRLPLTLPPLPEQRKIAAILSSVDEVIETTEAVIEQLQVVKKAMMQELLTRGLPGRHTRFKQTEIGEIPEQWEVAAIGSMCERMFVGIAQAATHAYVDSGGIPIIRTTNVRPNHLRMKGVLQVTEEFAEQMKSKRLSAGDVLSARTGYPGTSVVVPDELDGSQCFTLLVSRTGPGLLPQYLCHLMNSTIGDRIVSHGQAGGAQQNLNVTIFKKAIIPLPPKREQQQIVEAIDRVYDREWREIEVRSHLHRVKSALMSVLLTGEVRVTPDEEVA
jgi:type I restriction enzyme, S subunit